MKCPSCSKEFVNKKGVSNHLRWHNIPKYQSFQQGYREKISVANLGSRNGMWAGGNVKNGALHDYIKYHLKKPKLCMCCRNTPPYDLANKSGNYLRKLSDWEWLCRKCHMTNDGRLVKLNGMKRKITLRNSKGRIVKCKVTQ